MKKKKKSGKDAMLDGKKRGKVIHISESNAMIVLDGYDYSDNSAYPYHNVDPDRIKFIDGEDYKK